VALNADEEVMELFPSILSRAESEAWMHRADEVWDHHGLGPWAVEVVGGEPFIGYVGILPVEDDLPFAPSMEIGWRLVRDSWGKGYATEAAHAALRHAWAQGLDEVVSFTFEGNRRSRAVMERLGMARDPADDFEHPRLEPGHRLRPHVLYRAWKP
jgi:RimJ/RimL family protein N-acetyltransferase